MHVKWEIVTWVIVDRIHTDVWVSSRHVIVIVWIDDIAAAVSSCSHCVDEQKQSCWKKISKIVTDF